MVIMKDDLVVEHKKIIEELQQRADKQGLKDESMFASFTSSFLTLKIAELELKIKYLEEKLNKK